MKFFIPDVDDNEMAEKVYQSIVSFAKETTSWNVSNKRIFKINYHHNGKNYVAEVGQQNDTNGEKVTAILESNAYLVCTPNRGVVRGMPILVGEEEAFHVTEFDQESADKPDEQRLKEIDDELEKIHNLFKEYQSWYDEKTRKVWFPPGRYFDYQKMVDRESELLVERKVINERSKSA